MPKRTEGSRPRGIGADFDRLFNQKLSDLRCVRYREATALMHKEVLKRTRWQLLKNAEYLDTEKDEKRELDETLKRNQPLTTAY